MKRRFLKFLYRVVLAEVILSLCFGLVGTPPVQARGDKLLVSKDILPVNLFAPASLSMADAPSTIRVIQTEPYPDCRILRKADGSYVSSEDVDFKTYVKRVLPHEWVADWANDGYESLKAGAMAVKMFAWFQISIKGYVAANDCDQRYLNETDPRTDTAVDNTWNYIMTSNGGLFELHHMANCSTNNCMGQRTIRTKTQ